ALLRRTREDEEDLADGGAAQAVVQTRAQVLFEILQLVHPLRTLHLDDEHTTAQTARSRVARDGGPDHVGPVGPDRKARELDARWQAGERRSKRFSQRGQLPSHVVRVAEERGGCKWATGVGRAVDGTRYSAIPPPLPWESATSGNGGRVVTMPIERPLEQGRDEREAAPEANPDMHRESTPEGTPDRAPDDRPERPGISLRRHFIP